MNVFTCFEYRLSRMRASKRKKATATKPARTPRTEMRAVLAVLDWPDSPPRKLTVCPGFRGLMYGLRPMTEVSEEVPSDGTMISTNAV